MTRVIIKYKDGRRGGFDLKFTAGFRVHDLGSCDNMITVAVMGSTYHYVKQEYSRSAPEGYMVDNYDEILEKLTNYFYGI